MTPGSKLTVLEMYHQADWIVQAVMLLLFAASVLTWTILLAKHWQLHRTGKLLKQIAGNLQTSANLQAIHAITPSSDLSIQMLAAVKIELELSSGMGATAGIKARLASRLERIELAHERRMRNGIAPLASIGATAPFIGLFGTVWGIMNSFIGIAQANTTSLAVVAPGIAEALLATAMGLAAAIPAVLAYNYLVRQLAAIRDLAGDIGAAIEQVACRDLERLGAEKT